MSHLPEITFVSFGKPKEIWRPILAMYEGRLAKTTKFSHVILREKGDSADAVKANATKVLQPHIDGDQVVMIFDERGKSHTSVGLAKRLSSVRPRKLTAVIGTSYGLAAGVLDTADRLVSLGPLTLPHELARVVALEQLYRSETILANHPYHHG